MQSATATCGITAYSWHQRLRPQVVHGNAGGVGQGLGPRAIGGPAANRSRVCRPLTLGRRRTCSAVEECRHPPEPCVVTQAPRRRRRIEVGLVRIPKLLAGQALEVQMRRESGGTSIPFGPFTCSTGSFPGRRRHTWIAAGRATGPAGTAGPVAGEGGKLQAASGRFFRPRGM